MLRLPELMECILNASFSDVIFVGGMIPVVFSALAMNSVGKAAMDMVYEVRRQFRNSRNYGRNWKTRIC
jgi:Na+/H+-translocating membrane pyrophosphatase